MINPFDIVSGKVVQNHCGTFWFKEPGHNIKGDGWPIEKNLHREDGPAVIYNNGEDIEYWLDGSNYIKEIFDERVKCLSKYIDVFDILTGKIVINFYGIFYFDRPGNNLHDNGWVIEEHLHREDGPAFFHRSGRIEWIRYGKRHRLDGPAIIEDNGVMKWYINDERWFELDFEEAAHAYRQNVLV